MSAGTRSRTRRPRCRPRRTRGLRANRRRGPRWRSPPLVRRRAPTTSRSTTPTVPPSAPPGEQQLGHPDSPFVLKARAPRERSNTDQTATDRNIDSERWTAVIAADRSPSRGSMTTSPRRPRGSANSTPVRPADRDVPALPRPDTAEHQQIGRLNRGLSSAWRLVQALSTARAPSATPDTTDLPSAVAATGTPPTPRCRCLDQSSGAASASRIRRIRRRA
jgi:hypothetical protein